MGWYVWFQSGRRMETSEELWPNLVHFHLTVLLPRLESLHAGHMLVIPRRVAVWNLWYWKVGQKKSEEEVVYGLAFILAVGASWVFFRYRCKVCLNVAMAGQDCCGGRSMLDVSKHLEE
ncbi:hypothetical protein LAZ67_9001315 [Cordylochernes scorpioides]|uniref:Transmembrane protein n=1 Tax=Cordylochernes scorpioides TaxID=51811 RepID=A0ABY6KXX6_9ARAC|nr:hypothetical protein LAZ67_9001315 [Cordylochernes scorpioides]